MSFASALHEWHEFYVLVGTAGATLVALLFVAVGFGAGFLSPRKAAPTRAFISPVVVHFTAVFFIAALSLVPTHGTRFFAAGIVICAVIGAAVAIYSTVQLLRHRWTNFLRDHLAYGMLPAACYAALLIAAAMVLADNDSALDLLAGSLLVLLIVNIRNAWDLTLSMVHRQSGRRR
jgi:hypothetical protein